MARPPTMAATATKLCPARFCSPANALRAAACPAASLDAGLDGGRDAGVDGEGCLDPAEGAQEAGAGDRLDQWCAGATGEPLGGDEHEAGLFAAPALYGPAGGVSGRTTLAVAVWLIAWGILHGTWRRRTLEARGVTKRFAGVTALGGLYFILPRITGRPLHSRFLADLQYWLVLIGVTGFGIVLTVVGLIQGQAWYNGETLYRTLPTIQPYYVTRLSLGVQARKRWQ